MLWGKLTRETMKVLVENYSFNPATGVITFTDYDSIKLENVLLVTNVTSNVMLYNFAVPALGGAVTGNQLDLDFNTAAMSSTDSLQIFYENGKTPASDELIEAMYELINRLSFLSAVRGVSADLRVTPLATPNMGVLTTLSNLAGMAGYNTGPVVKDFDNITAINSNINNVAS